MKSLALYLSLYIYLFYIRCNAIQNEHFIFGFRNFFAIVSSLFTFKIKYHSRWISMNSRRSLLEGWRIFQMFLIGNNSSNLSNCSNRRFLNQLEPNKVTTALLEYAELSINLPFKYGGLSINRRIS